MWLFVKNYSFDTIIESRQGQSSSAQAKRWDGNMARGYDLETSQYHPSLHLLDMYVIDAAFLRARLIINTYIGG